MDYDPFRIVRPLDIRNRSVSASGVFGVSVTLKSGNQIICSNRF